MSGDPYRVSAPADPPQEPDARDSRRRPIVLQYAAPTPTASRRRAEPTVLTVAGLFLLCLFLVGTLAGAWTGFSLLGLPVVALVRGTPRTRICRLLWMDRLGPAPAGRGGQEPGRRQVVQRTGRDGFSGDFQSPAEHPVDDRATHRGE